MGNANEQKKWVEGFEVGYCEKCKDKKEGEAQCQRKN